MKFSWDERKARRNEREHGVSFELAQYALQSGLGFHAEDQFHPDEWRLVIIAPARGIFLLTIVITLRSEDRDAYDADFEDEQTIPGEWNAANSVIRIISARRATSAEQVRYFEDRLSEGQ